MNSPARPIASPSTPIPSVVERLADLRRQAQRLRYPGPTPQLPSRQSILALADDICRVIFPRHLGSRDLSNIDLDGYVGQVLERALPLLEREIALELSLPNRGEEAIAAHGDAAQIAANFIEALPRVRQLADFDVRAALAADPTLGSFDEVVFCSASVAALLRHRLAHELYSLGAPLTAKIIAADLRGRAGIDIHPGAEIDQGFSIVNAAGLTIGETAVIGKNVRVHAPVTLGESFAVGPDPEFGAENVIAFSGARAHDSSVDPVRRHPRIEDDVVIEAGASLFGPITIGRGSTIGRNAWLLRDVPPYSCIATEEV